MATLVENIVSLEKEADAIVAKARVEARELEKSTLAEAEAYRWKLTNDSGQKVSAFQKEMDEKCQLSIGEAQKELARALDAIDQIADVKVKEQIDRIVTRFSEL